MFKSTILKNALPARVLLLAAALLFPAGAVTAGEKTAGEETAAVVDVSAADNAKPKARRVAKGAPQNAGKPGDVAGGDKNGARPAGPNGGAAAAKPQLTADKAPRPVTPPPPPAPDESPEAKAKRKEIAEWTLERSHIEARLALEDTRRRAASAARYADDFSRKADEKSVIENTLALDAVRDNAALAKRMRAMRDLEMEAKRVTLEINNAITKYTGALTEFQKRQEVAKFAINAKPQRLKEPLVNGTLYISDRRISFNGAVTARLADRVIDRINFLNNQSATDPIFIVIDRSPGGSVAAGFQILKAMESSKAPVYVVVKGYAASMAAVITTLASRSFCYDNTIILHHQMSTMIGGNMSSLKDQMKTADKWYKRLAAPVAKKMGMSLEQFTKEMYKHNADADWEEFGTEALKLKWVDNVVERIVETGIVEEKPEPPAPRIGFFFQNGCEMRADQNGNPYIQLPVLENPFDCWWLYDKRGLYRAQ